MAAYKPPELPLPERKWHYMESPAQFMTKKELGEGGYSKVYQVEDVKTKETYAMKKVNACYRRWICTK